MPASFGLKKHIPYTRFDEKYAKGRRKRFRHYKEYIYLISITSRVDLAMSVCLSVRMNVVISETTKARKFGLGMQILEIPTK